MILLFICDFHFKSKESLSALSIPYCSKLEMLRLNENTRRRKTSGRWLFVDLTERKSYRGRIVLILLIHHGLLGLFSLRPRVFFEPGPPIFSLSPFISPSLSLSFILFLYLWQVCLPLPGSIALPYNVARCALWLLQLGGFVVTYWRTGAT